jgi:hypothetical protein
MGFSTLGRTLELMNDFEKNQIDFYLNLKAGAMNEGAKLIVNYLIGRKCHIPESMDYYSASDMFVIKSTPILEEENVVSDLNQFVKNRTLSAGADSDSLLDCAITFAQIRIKCIMRIMQQRIGNEVIAFLKTLSTMEVRDIKELKKIKAMNYF